MEYLTIFLGVSAVFLGYFSYNFEVLHKSETLLEALNHYKQTQGFRYLAATTLLVVFGYLLYSFMTSKAPQPRNKYYSQRISKKEFENQKKGYTQQQLAKLMNSEEFRRHMSGRQPASEDGVSEEESDT